MRSWRPTPPLASMPRLRRIGLRAPRLASAFLGFLLVIVFSAGLAIPAAAQTPTQTFDHYSTGFALEGAHKRLACESCHVGGRFASLPTRCDACHNGVLAPGKPVTHITTTAQCDQCHNTTSYTDVRFDHSLTNGSCVSCHSGVTAIGKPPTHIATSASCDTCHSTSTWTVSRFDHTSITGSCASCHNGTTATGKPPTHIATIGRLRLTAM